MALRPIIRVRCAGPKLLKLGATPGTDHADKNRIQELRNLSGQIPKDGLGDLFDVELLCAKLDTSRRHFTMTMYWEM